MHLTSIEITTKDSANKNLKIIQELNFIINSELVASFACTAVSYLALDVTNTSICFNDVKKYKYSNLEKSESRDSTKLQLNRYVFLRLLMYAETELEYDVSLHDKQDIELVAEIFKKLI